MYFKSICRSRGPKLHECFPSRIALNYSVVKNWRLSIPLPPPPLSTPPSLQPGPPTPSFSWHSTLPACALQPVRDITAHISINVKTFPSMMSLRCPAKCFPYGPFIPSSHWGRRRGGRRDEGWGTERTLAGWRKWELSSFLSRWPWPGFLQRVIILWEDLSGFVICQGIYLIHISLSPPSPPPLC